MGAARGGLRPGALDVKLQETDDARVVETTLEDVHRLAIR